MKNSKRWYLWGQAILNRPRLVYGLISLTILLPLLKPGYVFALDMVFGPELPIPKEVTASYPFYTFLWLLHFVVPVWLLQKIILFSIFLLCGLGAHQLSRYLLKKNKLSSQAAPFYAGLLYTINPFTYERFMDGQFAVLLGYALLPFFTKALLQLMFDNDQTLKKALLLALWMLLICIVSIHAIGYMLILIFGVVGVLAWNQRKHISRLWVTVRWLFVSIAVTLLASSYWLVPTIVGNTGRESLIGQFDNRHLLTFRTDGATDVGAIANSAGLYGYWGEREDRFLVPKNVLVYWPVLAVAIVSLAGFGWWSFRRSADVNTLLVATLIALILALGITVTPVGGINKFLYNHVPYFRGFREPQKFVAVIALAYATLGSLGLAQLFRQSRLKKWSPSNRQALLILLIFLPIMYTPVIFLGGLNQLEVRDYPSGWYEVREYLKQEPKQTTLFLPWHQYMHFDFAGTVIATPADQFFGGNIISGDNAEIGLIERQIDNPKTAKIESILLAAKAGEDISSDLRNSSITYILLSKNADWGEYGYLNSFDELEVVKDTGSITLYEVRNK